MNEPKENKENEKNDGGGQAAGGGPKPLRWKNRQTHQPAKKTLPDGWATCAVIVGPDITVPLGRLAQVLSQARLARLVRANCPKRLALARSWLGLDGLKKLADKSAPKEVTAAVVESVPAP